MTGRAPSESRSRTSTTSAEASGAGAILRGKSPKSRGFALLHAADKSDLSAEARHVWLRLVIAADWSQSADEVWTVRRSYDALRADTRMGRDRLAHALHELRGDPEAGAHAWIVRHRRYSRTNVYELRGGPAEGAQSVAVPSERTQPHQTAALVDEVFDYFRERTGRNRLTLTPAWRRKIMARLRRFSVAQLKQAVDGALLNPFYLGENDQERRYDFPETIFRDDGVVERHIEHAIEGPTRAAAPRRRKTPQKYDYSNASNGFVIPEDWK